MKQKILCAEKNEKSGLRKCKIKTLKFFLEAIIRYAMILSFLKANLVGIFIRIKMFIDVE